MVSSAAIWVSFLLNEFVDVECAVFGALRQHFVRRTSGQSKKAFEAASDQILRNTLLRGVNP
jgi:hypothetical protein